MVNAKEQLPNCGLLLKHWTKSIDYTALVHIECPPRLYAASVNNVKRPLLELYNQLVCIGMCQKSCL